MSQSNKKICHITTAHPRYDIRIYIKECISLSLFFNVNLIVADGKGNELINDIQIIDVFKGSKSRINRFFMSTRRAYKAALELDCEIYHFHDPELLLCGLLLRKKGKKVFYDVHEDLPKQVMSKNYLNPIISKILSKAIIQIENFAAPRMTVIITVTKSIYERFSTLNKKCFIINNYPKLDEYPINEEVNEKKNEICYIGGITRVRGIGELIDSIENIDVRLNLAGNFESDSFRQFIMSKPGWKKVNYLGYISLRESFDVMLRCFAGISTLYPEPNYLTSQATKIYEYMYAGIPVIASNFPLWKEFILSNKCGICVDPLNRYAISEAIIYLKNNPVEAKTMGNNGRSAVIERYSWKTEEEKLIQIYNQQLQL